mmetsp:Transcript_53933/g.154876  ORF Transcript_53933/g.154876 Transcript_53933/m.154876 type:complete len:204 (-) Transcript_53933:602-1213(-)
MHGLVELRRPVRGQDQQTVEALEFREQERHQLGAVPGLEQCVALVEEDEGIGQCRLAENLPHGFRWILCKQRHRDKQQLFAQMVREGVRKHRLAGARRAMEEEDNPETIVDEIVQAYALAVLPKSGVAFHCVEDQALHMIGQDHTVDTHVRLVQVSSVDQLAKLRVEAHAKVQHPTVHLDGAIHQIPGGAHSPHVCQPQNSVT